MVFSMRIGRPSGHRPEVDHPAGAAKAVSDGLPAVDLLLAERLAFEVR